MTCLRDETTRVIHDPAIVAGRHRQGRGNETLSSRQGSRARSKHFPSVPALMYNDVSIMYQIDGLIVAR